MVTKATTFGGALLSMKRVYLTLALILGLTEAHAITIRFDDADRPPSDTLNVGGVSVTGNAWGGPGLPATAFGLGLGSDIQGSSFSIDCVSHYSSGDLFSDVSLAESLRLAVAGVINSITIMPRVTVLETGESLDLFFEVAPLSYSSDHLINPPNFTPVESDGAPTTIICFPKAPVVDFAIAGDFREDTYFFNHRVSRGFPDETLVFGFSILSLDYTPASVPDTASSACLLGIGLFAIVCVGRKFRRTEAGCPIEPTHQGRAPL